MIEKNNIHLFAMNRVDESHQCSSTTDLENDFKLFIQSKFLNESRNGFLVRFSFFKQNEHQGLQIDPIILNRFFGHFEQHQFHSQFDFIPKLLECFKTMISVDEQTHDLMSNIFYEFSNVHENVGIESG